MDLDNLLIKVYGKGGRERIIPFSVECQKHLYEFLKTHKQMCSAYSWLVLMKAEDFRRSVELATA